MPDISPELAEKMEKIKALHELNAKRSEQMRLKREAAHANPQVRSPADSAARMAKLMRPTKVGSPEYADRLGDYYTKTLTRLNTERNSKDSNYSGSSPSLRKPSKPSKAERPDSKEVNFQLTPPSFIHPAPAQPTPLNIGGAQPVHPIPLEPLIPETREFPFVSHPPQLNYPRNPKEYRSLSEFEDDLAQHFGSITNVCNQLNWDRDYEFRKEELVQGLEALGFPLARARVDEASAHIKNGPKVSFTSLFGERARRRRRGGGSRRSYVKQPMQPPMRSSFACEVYNDECPLAKMEAARVDDEQDDYGIPLFHYYGMKFTDIFPSAKTYY